MAVRVNHSFYHENALSAPTMLDETTAKYENMLQMDMILFKSAKSCTQKEICWHDPKYTTDGQCVGKENFVASQIHLYLQGLLGNSRKLGVRVLLCKSEGYWIHKQVWKRSYHET